MAEYFNFKSFNFKSSSAFPKLPGNLGPAQVLEKNRYDNNGGYLFLKIVISGDEHASNIITAAYFIKNKYYNDADDTHNYHEILWQDYDISNMQEAFKIAKVLALFTENFISEHYENTPIKKEDFLFLGKKLGLRRM